MIAAGIKDDWIPFVEKSGIRSGLLARIIPVLSFDREAVRLGFQRMPKRSFSLVGIKNGVKYFLRRVSGMQCERSGITADIAVFRECT